ncbi:DUF4423 domain-containing protein [bacterium]|nr:DUF4423 domain-containing protein [bacterium]
MPAPIVSEVLRGKRPITRQLATRLLMHLDLESTLVHKLVESLPIKRSIAVHEDRSLKRFQLTSAEFQVISDWWHFAILALLDSGVEIGRAEELTKYFPLTSSKARKAIQALQSLGLIHKDGSYLRSTGKKFSTTHDVSDAFIRSNHSQGLDLARSALFEIPVELRDFSSVTVSCDAAALPALKEQLKLIRRTFAQTMEKTVGKNTRQNNKEVYRLQIQLFPLTKKEKT